jgi:hypothetical protein
VTRIIRTCLKAGIFGAFHLFLFDRRQPICIKDRAKNPPKIPCFEVEDLKKSGFLFNQGKNAANTVVLASILTQGERKSAFLRQVRIILVTLRYLQIIISPSVSRMLDSSLVRGSSFFFLFNLPKFFPRSLAI